MWLNKSILFATAILIVSILFLTSTTATNCKTVTKTHHRTKTIHPTNCPKTKTTTVTVRSTTTKPTTTTTTTTTIITTTSTVVPTSAPEKRHENEKVICIPNKKQNISLKHGKCVQTVYCTPTVILKCPKPRTKTLTATRTFTSTSVSVTTTTATATTTSTTVISCCTPGAFQTQVPLQLHSPSDVTPNGATDPSSCCVACAQEPNCVQWDFSFNRCFLFGGATCDNPVIPFGSGATAGGIMRCQDGCIPSN